MLISRLLRPSRLVLVHFLYFLLLSGPARAQEPENIKIGPVVADARGSLGRYKQSAALAAPYGIAQTELPTLGLGFDVGGHWYPVKWKIVTFGVGASFHVSRGHHGAPQVDGKPVGKEVTQRFTSFAPQLSFNFSGLTGWSYLSGGIGSSHLTIASSDPTVTTPSTTPTPVVPDSAAATPLNPWRRTINYGGGARWFLKDRLAFSLDIRFYAINPQIPLENVTPAPRMTLMVISAGVAFK